MSALYDNVVALVIKETRCGRDRITPQTTLFGDLGINGDDAAELLEAFERQFNVNMHGFVFSRHFGREAFAFWAPLFWAIYFCRRGTPEARCGLVPVTVDTLVASAERGHWTIVQPSVSGACRSGPGPV